jgi:hypothetical protein
VIPKHISEFLRSAVKSTWALDVLRLLKKSPDRAWSVPALIAELRGSTKMVEDILAGFHRWGLAAEDDDGYWRYVSDNALDATIADLMAFYAERPVAVIAEIALSPNEKLYTFIDAFRVTKDKD